MNLTKLEREILNHRLEVPDAIADAIDQKYNFHDVEAIAERFERGNFDLAFELPELARAVLIDAVEGSTYYACQVTDCVSPQRLAAVERAGNSLARKVGELVGDVVEFPVW